MSPTPDGTADAYWSALRETLACPGYSCSWTALGLRPRHEEMADRMARSGCAVLVPNLFYRGGPAPVVPDVVTPVQTEDRAGVPGRPCR